MAQIYVVNARDHAEYRDHSGYYRSMNRFLYTFGEGSTHVLVYAYNEETALEETAAFLKDQGWNGLFSEPDYKEAFEDLKNDPPLVVEYPDGIPCRFQDENGFTGEWCLQHISVEAATSAYRHQGYPAYACQGSVHPDRSFENVTWEQIRVGGEIDSISEKVLQAAEEDHVYTESGYILAWTYSCQVNPTKQDLLNLAHHSCIRLKEAAASGFKSFHQNHVAKVRPIHEYNWQGLKFTNENTRCENAGGYGSEAQPGNLVTWKDSSGEHHGRYLGKVQSYVNHGRIVVMEIAMHLGHAYMRTPKAEEVIEVREWPVNMLAWLSRKELPDMDILQAMDSYGSLSEPYISDGEARAQERLDRIKQYQNKEAQV